MKGRVLVGLLACWLGACSAHRNCLQGAIAAPFANRGDLQLVQREFQRGSEAPPAVRARIYEALPSLFPDLSEWPDEPECAPELVATLADQLESRPFAFNNATLHELDALGRVEDTTDVMSEKARLLLRVVALSDDAIGSYQRWPGERGPTPAPAQLRARALAHLVGSNLFLNDRRVRRFVLDKALQSSDPREEGLLAFTAAEVFQGSGEARYARPLLERWLTRSRQRLSGPPDPAALEVLLAHVNYLGAYADRHGLEKPAQALFQSIITADGRFPLTRGLEGGAFDLWARARQALDDNSNGPEQRHWLEPSLPFPARRQHSRSAWALDDATVIEWEADVSARRLRELDQELAKTREPGLYCWLLQQRGVWTPPAARLAWFNALLVDARVPSCALTEALSLEGVPAAIRARTLEGLLALSRPPVRRVSNSAPSAVLMAQLALIGHPDWLDSDVQLQERLIEQALGEDAAPLWEAKHDGHSIDMARVRLDFQAVLERALRLQLASPAPAARARAQALGRHWLEVARAAERGEPNDIYTFQLATAFLLALASFGPRLGLEQEVEALLTTLPEKPDGGVRLARFLFERARR